ncbi:MAG TPA: hypothetical protein VK158_05325 [Acidobacteriota bacterium]|nr:hypothetical protein [Acidobacteriota bacterium]
MMRIPKEYGSYKTDWCPYCGKKALNKNDLGLNVCKLHIAEKNEPILRDTEGKLMEVKCGKFGNYCFSLRRGNISLKDAFRMNGKEMEN